MEEENELLDDEEFADGDIIEFLRGLMKKCSCTVEKHKEKQSSQPCHYSEVRGTQ